MFGPFDEMFDFDGDGNLDDIEQAAELGFIAEEVFGDEEDEDEDDDDW